MKEKPAERSRLTAEDLDKVRSNLDWQAMFAGLGLDKNDKKSKPNDWWALSPFNDENTASFHMGTGGRWYDFSAGIGGGGIELIQQLEGVNCFEAGQIILDRGWSVLPENPRETAPKTGQTARKTRRTVSKALKQTKDADAAEQTDSKENAPIRQDLLPMCSYHALLESRGISEETAEELGIGYLAQGRSSLRNRIVFQVRDARTVKGDDLSLQPVILSHVGRAVEDDQDNKYLFYPGFQKSREILGQDRLWLAPLAIEQIKARGEILITEGPFDWAKAIEADVQNVGAAFGANLSEAQAVKLKALCDHHGVSRVRILFDRDEAGVTGAEAGRDLLEAQGLDVEVFDWDAPIGQSQDGPVTIPENIRDLAEFSATQIGWLRQKGWL